MPFVLIILPTPEGLVSFPFSPLTLLEHLLLKERLRRGLSRGSSLLDKQGREEAATQNYSNTSGISLATLFMRFLTSEATFLLSLLIRLINQPLFVFWGSIRSGCCELTMVFWYAITFGNTF